MPLPARDGLSRRRTARRMLRRTSSRRPASSRSRPLILLLHLLPGVSAAVSLRRATTTKPAVFPYTPTTILAPSSNDSLVYIFTPNDSGQVSLLSLNISSTLSTEAADKATTLSQGVPFLSDDGQENTVSTFTASIRADGAVIVYAGDCSDNVASVWTYLPPTDDTGSDAATSAQWTNGAVSLGSSQSGPWFLGGSTAYSSQLEPTVSNATLYVYGGMCPSTSTATASATTSSSTAITAANWQSQASYSSSMFKLVPADGTYVPSTLSSKGHPVAEAGFTLTSLSPSLANRSGTVTQQVNSVLLGGHTKAAFINMSTAALWSLPEESWSYVSIADPTDTSQQTTTPDSRSGHTAVLSEDGSSIVVLGGWVGDVTQAADPQLAILELGTGYDQWQWSIPAAQPSGSGIYGHGAAMLPGNVMVVYGGYNISSSSSARRVRRQTSEGTLQFFNLTSQSWTTEYTNPLYAASSAPSQSAPSSGSPSKVGLGVGLGLGIPLALLLLALAFCFFRRRSSHRRRRDDAVRGLAQDHNRFLHGHDEMVEAAGYTAFPTPMSPHDQNSFYTGGHDPYNIAASQPYGPDSLSPAFPTYQSPNLASSNGDGAAVRVQPPRNVARGMYQPTSMNDYEASLAMGGAAGAAATAGIHPIYEADEEDEGGSGGSGGAVVQTPRGKHRRGASVITTESTDRPVSAQTEELTDPFMTPSTVSMAVSPMRSVYAGAFAPATVHLNPFARNTPSPESGGAHSSPSRSSSPGHDAGAVSEREKENEGALTVGQDQDVQHWVAGLAIEDLLFSPPLPGAAAAVAASVSPAPSQVGTTGSQRGRSSPTNAGYWSSMRHKTSSAGSPTRSSFFGGSHGRGGGGGDDEARTGSNLSERSAFTFLSHTGSSRSRRGGAGAYTMLDPKASNSDTSTATYMTAPSGFQTLRVEGPGLLYGRGHTEKESSTGEKATAGTDFNSGFDDNNRVGSLAPPASLLPSGEDLSPGAYGGAASVMASGARVGGTAAPAAAYAPLDYFRKQRGNYEEEEDHMDLSGSPSKRKSRRTWVNSFMRIFSSGSPENGHNQDAQTYATDGIGTGAQQEPDFRDVAHATLLRRKQGRFDWEADEVREEESTAAGTLRTGRSASAASARGLGHGHGYSHGQSHGHANSGPATSGAAASGSIAAGRRDGSGNSDEWDVEKAVQNRVVQVMFTMPRDQQLRVVNGEAEKEDEDAESASLQRKPSSATRPQDGVDEFNEKRNELQLGGLSPPPPAPPAHAVQRPAQSYQRASVAEDTEASRARAATPSRHDEQLLRMEEDLASSKQQLAEKAALEPWMFRDEDKFQSGDRPKGQDQNSDAAPVAAAAATIPPSVSSKGKTADEAVRSSGLALQRPMTPENRPTRAAAAILQAGGSAGRRTPSPAKTVSGTEDQPTTPVRAPRPVRSAAGLRRTPTLTPNRTPNRTPTRSPERTPRALDRHGTPSFESQLTGWSSRESFHSAASSRWRGYAEDSTVLGSSPGGNALGLVKKPSGYVLGMVEKIETGSPPKSPSLASKSSSLA